MMVSISLQKKTQETAHFYKDYLLNPHDDKQPGEGGRSSPKPHVDALWLRPLSNGAAWPAGVKNK